MIRITTEIDKIRRTVLTDVARLAFDGKLLREIEDLPYQLYDKGIKNYRCCEYKERAVLRERIRLALGQDPSGDREPLVKAATRALKAEQVTEPMLKVIDLACDECPIDRILVTDACRNCVAHNCENACPKDAIHVINGKAMIEKDKCIECGLCVGACQFGAILKIQRPCERACEVGAISSGEGRHAVIDQKLCVECGQCTVSCPFGAISYKSEILPVILKLLEGSKVTALIAPSAPGQFGRKLELGQLVAGLEELGFTDCVELGFAAAEIAEEEARELGDEWLTNSCCPAYKSLVEKHYPKLKDHISGSLSPMAHAAKQLKEEDPDNYIVFIGPCLAKKTEVPELVDAVLTFEELACLFVAKKINLSSLPAKEVELRPPQMGRGFAASGGVAEAIRSYKEIESEKGEGLLECKKILAKAEKLGLAVEFLEGMACQGGCIGGPGTMVDQNRGKRALLADLKEADKVKKTG